MMMIKTKPKKVGVTALAGIGTCLFPLLFPEWTQVLAENYSPPLALPEEAANPNSFSVATAINVTCLTGNNATGSAENKQFQEDCNVLVGGAVSGAEGTADALVQVTDDEVAAQNAVSTRSVQVYRGVVFSRLQQLRTASVRDPGNVFSANPQIAMFGNSRIGGGASPDANFGPFGFFLNAKYFDGNENSDKFQPGFDIDGTEFVAGLDYRLSDKALLGVTVGYTDSDIKYDNSGGKMDYTNLSGSLYGSYYMTDRLFFDAMAGYGRAEYKMKRKIRYDVDATEVNQTARSKPDGDQYSLSIAAGYDYFMGAWAFTPRLGVDYLRNSVDSTDEKISDPTDAGGGMAVSLDSVNYTSLTSNLGMNIGYAVKSSWGVIVPQVSGEWVHEYKNDGRSINGFFRADINKEGFVIQTKDPDRDYFNLNLGVAAQFARGKSAFISYQKLLGYDEGDLYSIEAGMRLEF